MGLKKRGQLTAFIIIAVILLFSSAIYFYYRNYSINQQIIQPVEQIQQAPAELQPVVNQIQSCLKTTTTEALAKIGMMGGYTSLDPDKFEFGVPGVSQGDALNIGGSLYSPYWVYQVNGLDSYENAPLLYKETQRDNSIQSHIEEYVNDKIGLCLNNFEQLRNQGFDIKEEGAINTSIEFTDNNVVASLDYPLKVTRNGQEKELRRFRDEIPVRMQKIYEIAGQILVKEYTDNIFERATLDSLLLTYEGFNPDSLPPRHGGSVREACADKKTWQMSSVKQELQGMLDDNIPYLRVNNTSYKRLRILKANEPDDFIRAVQNNFFTGLILNVTPYDYTGFTVDFTPYDLSDFSINNLGEQGTLEPLNIFEYPFPASGECEDTYDYQYTFQYPILVTITDNTLGNEYQFQFPVMVIIKDNWPRYSLAEHQGDSMINETNVTKAANLLDCSDNQEKSDKIKVKVVNSKFPDQPVEKASISYQCGPYSNVCTEGYTNSSGEAIVRFKKCSYGFVVLKNENYMDTWYPLSTDNIAETGENDFTYEMVPLREVSLNVISYKSEYPLINMPSPPCVVNTEQILQLTSDDVVSFRMTRLTKDNTTFTENTPLFTPDGTQKINIAPGKYNLNMQIIHNFPPDNPLTFKKDSQFDINDPLNRVPEFDMSFPLVMTGGVDINFTIPEDYTTKNTMNVYLENEGIPTYVFDVNAPASRIGYCSNYGTNEDILKPTFT